MKNLENTMNLNYILNSRITINDFLDNTICLSTRLKNKLIRSKCILLNSKFVDTRSYCEPNDKLTIILDSPEDNSNIKPKKMPLDIIYEDSHILILNKPAGMPVHPSMLHFEDSLSNGVKYYFDSIGLKKKIRAVNRIDLNTSGLVLFAKNEYIQECLIRQMQNHAFSKTYLALIAGHLSPKDGTINAPISRKENSIIERCVSSSGQAAITHYQVIKEFDGYSLVKCLLETGRTHQIRVHMAYKGAPLLGDTLYGNKPTNLIGRQALHSYEMSFIHPINGEKMHFLAPISKDMEKLII